MRTRFTIVLTVFGLAIGAGCKKKVADDPTGAAPVQKTEETKNLDKAHDDLADARARYTSVAKERLAKLDARIDELGKRADEKSRETAARLRARRDQVAAKLDTTGDKASSAWEDFKKDVDSTFDTLEKEVDDLMK